DYAELLKRDLIVRLDQQNIKLRHTASNFPEPAELRTGFGIIQLEFTVMSGSLAGGAHRLSVENRHLPTASVYLFNAAKPVADAVEITAQRRNENQSACEIFFTIQAPATPAHALRNIGLLAALFLAVFAGIYWTRKSSLPPKLSSTEPVPRKKLAPIS
ncbi:MAG: hypothetical protein QOD99_1556, partial [Chthoniobacter sp.]|nr:hypothetical protein [Chthoniobacter sp.]